MEASHFGSRRCRHCEGPLGLLELSALTTWQNEDPGKRAINEKWDGVRGRSGFPAGLYAEKENESFAGPAACRVAYPQ